MESGLNASEVADDDGKLTTADLVSLFEASEEASFTARKASERDRDYHDNIQLTSEELSTLKKRGQPPYIDNRIKTKIDYLVGLEKQQRINPRALPRTPKHEDDADSASQALNYVADKENFDYKRSAIWRNLLIEGAGGMSVSVENTRYGVEIKLQRVAWDRMFWDPHSSEVDFSDASYLGTVQWLDYDEALGLYGEEAREALDVTMASVTASDTYDDRPKYNLWADKKRRRVRICAIWIKRGEDWHFAEYTKGGILKAGPSPYQDDKGRSDCELIFQSAYVDRDNNRFGLVRELISLQDAINKRNSKALHQLNTAQIVTTRLAIADQNIESLRREAAKPDGVIILEGAPDGSLENNFKFNTRTDLAQAQFLLLQEAKNSIDLKGPNATSMGDKAGGSAAASGRAIIASQQGGMVSLGDLLDNLRHLDIRTFRAIWNRVRQFWTEERWIRVTDDERTIKWVGMNVDPQMMQMAMMQNPQMADKIKGVIGSVAELDCDIIIDEAPDSVTPALEQWQALVELAKAGIQIPPAVLVKAAPNLKDKARLLEEMEGASKNPIQEMGVKLEMEGKDLENKKLRAEIAEIMHEIQSGGGADPQAQQFEMQTRAMDAEARQMEGQVKLAGIAAKAQADRVKAGLDIEGKQLDLVGKRLDIQRQREAPPPPQRAA